MKMNSSKILIDYGLNGSIKNYLKFPSNQFSKMDIIPTYRSYSKREDFNIHQPYDTLFKLVISYYPQAFIDLFDLDFEFKQFKSKELINEVYQKLYADEIVESKKNGIYLIEFQSSSITDEDCMRFGSYLSLIHKKTGEDVHLYIISLVDEDYEFDYIAGDLRFTIHIKSLTSFDYKKNLNIIKSKIENKEPLNDKEILILMLLPLMAKEELRKEVLLETVKLTNKLDYLSKDKILEIKNTQVILAYQLFKDDELNRILDVISMEAENEVYKILEYANQLKIEQIEREHIQKTEIARNEALEKGMKKGRNEGLKKGMKKGRNELISDLIKAKNYLKQGKSIKEISALISIPEETLQELM